MGTTGHRPGSSLALIGFACGVLALGASSPLWAQDAKPADQPVDAWAQIVPREASQSEAAADPNVTATVNPSAIQTEPDWTELGKFPDSQGKTPRAARPAAKPAGSSAWSRSDHANGTSSVAVKSEVSPFLDARVGADMNVVKAPPTNMADGLSDKMLSGETPKSSTGTAWASMAGPGVPHIWDKTAVDVSMDSGTDQGKFGTTLSRSVPLADNAYSVTLQNAYRLTQPAPTPVTSPPENRTLEIERSAKFSVNGTGTSVIAGQTLSSTDDKWLGKVGAEQKLLGSVTVNGTVSETARGPANKALTAGFKTSW
jgi:hypothetical protein